MIKIWSEFELKRKEGSNWIAESIFYMGNCKNFNETNWQFSNIPEKQEMKFLRYVSNKKLKKINETNKNK
jgi:hypothetical protein